ncbi:MAG: translocation/assembly module TamB domain-containing protein [Terracidiphilus sp.]
MSEHDTPPFPPEPPPEPESPQPAKRSRMRRFLLRHLPLTVAAATVLLLLTAVGAYFAASSAAFENLVRQRLIARIDALTGGRAEIQSFHWRLLHLEAQADGIVIHGLEDPREAPYAQIGHLRVQVSVLGFLSPRILLRGLEIDRPKVHLIVYPDGSTNQPHPRRPAKRNQSAIDTLFDLRAGRIAVDQGVFDYDDRASAFDSDHRYLPLDFQANAASLVLRYVPAGPGAPEFYHLEAGATNLVLNRDLPRKKDLPVEGKLEVALDLERNRVSLRSFRLTAHNRGVKDRTLEVTGALDDFNHPRWQTRVAGDLDMRLLDPVFGYADSPEGIAHLDLFAGGLESAYRIQGAVHLDGGSYVAHGIEARGVSLDAQVYADPSRLFIDQAVARLRTGGQIEGSIDLHPWLPPHAPAPAQVAAAGTEQSSASRNVLVKAPLVPTPMNGKVTADFKGVALDTILDFVAAPEYRRLGFDARVTGPATATWSNGDDRTIAVGAAFILAPSTQTPQGEIPSSGVIDATYTQRNGGVDLRKLELHLPASDVEAHGALGAHPVTSASALTVDFRSRDLSEFDAVLRSLGLKRNGKTGSAALPVALAGQAEFHGSWTGSLEEPHLSGALKAAEIALEIPSLDANSGAPRFVHFDSLDAAGSYSPTQISIDHAQLLHGPARVVLHGTLDAADGAEPDFDANSIVHARIQAASLDLADVQPFFAAPAGKTLPVSGVLNTQLQADGPLHAPSVSGSVEMSRAVLYGEPVTELRIEGAMANQVLQFKSASLRAAGGTVSASGSLDLKAGTFQGHAHGAGIDVSRIDWVRRNNVEAAGSLEFSLDGSGTWNDPRLDARTSIDAPTLGGQRFDSFAAAAHTANRKLFYTLDGRLQDAALHLVGQTAFDAGYDTQAQLDFSRFNVGALLRIAHVEAFTADSALAGKVTVQGPLADLDRLRGEAQLRQMAVTIAGVHLESQGGAHATLAGGRIRLDPLHVTGEDTDLHLEGGLSLQSARQLDLAASGSVNLKLAETLDPDLTASGVSTFQVEAHGPVQHPDLKGRVDFQNGSLSLEDLPNGLSQLHGTLEFNQNRLEVKSMTAMSGGGQLSLGGYLAYQHGIFADLSVTGKEVHIRYPEGVSSLADATLQLQGPQNNLLLSGDVLITRFAASPDLDLASLAVAAGSSVQSVAPPNAPSNHVRLDVHIASSPQLNFQNAFAKLAGNVDLRLRGTLASPSLLGRVSVTEGSALIAGTRYDLERGDVTFTNPVRIEPVIDLSATAHVEDYDISLGLHGSPQKLAVSYRSDPPLPEADVVSLLALGHTASQQRLYTQQQEQSISNPTTDALLGGALNATVSSRVQKLFGAGSVKVDPNYLGAFGNSTSRITVEEQLGRVVTLTYATNVNTTSQQLLQAEVAINRHVSLVVARDESGVFSMVIKATRRYR